MANKSLYEPTLEKPMGLTSDKRPTIVTGGDGFLGRVLIAKLKTLGVPTDDFDITKGDNILNLKALQERVPKEGIIFHLAALLGTHELMSPSKTKQAIAVNIRGSVNIFQSAMRNGASVVFVTKPNPWLNTYSLTKETAEKFGMMYSQEPYRADIKGARLYSLYGPGQVPFSHHVEKAIPAMTVRALRGEPIKVYGDGCSRQMGANTADVCFCSRAALERDAPNGT